MSVAENVEHSHGHGAEHSTYQQHHFATAEQQADASKIGMWLFLVTEVLIFGGLFVGYGMMQNKFPEAWKSAHHHLQRELGALNTVVLLISSFTMVMAVQAAKLNRRKQLIGNLWVTIICAVTFLGVKYFEYSHKYHEGLLPFKKFYSYEGPQVPGEFHFFSFYFMMTGLHGFHILGGVVVLFWLLKRSYAGDFSNAYYTPVDLVGLYWHLVDLIWIYLFPLLYLIS